MAGKCKYFWKIQSGMALNHMKCSSESESSIHKVPLVYVIIPGNPGCIHFYETFAEALHTSSHIPVWGVSHTGHVHSKEDDFPHPPTLECGLENQIQQKMEYLDQEVFPFADRVILIGHSIGCYIILQIIERMQERKSSFLKGVLLFPTIEQMRQTPKGLKMTLLLSNARWSLVFAVGLLRLLPESVVSWLIPLFVKSTDKCVHQTIADHFNSKVTDCCSYMGLQEMYEVKERDDRIIEANADRLIFYYGAKDEWCPTTYFHEVYKQHGWRDGSHIQLCQKGMPHAFVLTHSVEMAELVSQWTSN